MSQNYLWPAQTVNATNPSVGINGATAPTSATLVAGINQSDGDLQPLQTNAAGSLLIAPTPGTTGDVNLTEVGGSAITLGQKASTVSLPVVIASDQSTLPISAASLPLPAGAATSANQTNGTQVTSVNNFPATQPVSGTVTVVQPTGSNLHADIDSSALPTGASTSANQALELAQLTDINANQTNGTQTSIVTQTTAADLNATVVGSGNFTVVQPTGTNLHTVVDSSALPTGAATSANQTTAIANQTNGTQKSQIATPTALAITQTLMTIGTTAQRLTVSGSAPAADRVALVFTPDKASTASYYIGSSTVTNSGSTAGIQIEVGQVFIANNDAGDYWIVASAAASLGYVMEQS